MNLKHVLMTMMALAGPALLPASAGATWNGTDQYQCAHGYVDSEGSPKWTYGSTTRFRPEARPSSEKACNAKAASCVYYGCFRRK